MLKRNVLIFHSAALGDFVLSWPLALAAGRLFPQSRIIYITQKSKGQLAERVLRVESIDSEAGWHGLFSLPPEISAGQKKIIEQAHTIFTFSVPGENLKQFCPDARIIPLSTKPTVCEGGSGSIHLTQQLIEQLKGHPAIAEALRQILNSIRGNGLSAKPQAAADVDLLIHPGSGSPDKNWPLENFLDLAKRSLAKNNKVRFIIGEAERERFSRSELSAIREVAEVREPATYLDVATEIAKARTFLGNDSGPTHLAGILGIKTIAIFRSTDRAIWSPIGPRVTALNASECTPDFLLTLL